MRFETKTETGNFSQTEIITPEKTVIIHSFESKCEVLTKAELQEDSLENDTKVSKVRVKKTEKPKKFLAMSAKRW